MQTGIQTMMLPKVGISNPSTIDVIEQKMATGIRSITIKVIFVNKAFKALTPFLTSVNLSEIFVAPTPVRMAKKIICSISRCKNG